MSAVLGLALGPDRRRRRRETCSIEARIVSDELWCVLDCTIVDQSADGAKLRIGYAVTLPATFSLSVPSQCVTIPVRSVWRRHQYIGVEFAGPAVASSP